MLRKPLVNDVVHSFCYCCRTGGTDFPVVILGNCLVTGYDSSVAIDITPFAVYAFTKNKNYIIATRLTILMASWLRAFSIEEQLYAVKLLEKYYGYRPACIVGESDDQPELRRYREQGVCEAAILPECYQLLDD